MRLILASTSPYRQALLQRLALPFTCCAPDFDEAAVPDDSCPPEVLAAARARGKAAAVADTLGPGDWVVIGSDQVCALDQQVLSKPGNQDAAVAQLLALQGRTHHLHTAVCLRWQRAEDHGERAFRDSTELHMLPLDEVRIRAYLQRDRAWDCAGSYKLEQGGIALFERIISDDHSAVTGLPLLRLAAALRELGMTIPPPD